ncbi:phosphatase PAP2 family protein [Bacillus salitolerans]|uniref:Phosphatase PAP2 family protein n=1 Tax=Bacillus salitolerans TaxID=1437434 RepID=A0ABW4LVN9_9BACI
MKLNSVSNEEQSYVNKKHMFILVIISASLYSLISALLMENKQLWIDSFVLNIAESTVNERTYQYLSFITKLGSKPVVISIAVMALALLWLKARDYLGMATIALVLIGSDQLYKVLKDIYKRERPIHDPFIDAIGYGFPSGHSTVTMAFYGILIYFIWRLTKTSLRRNVIITFFAFYILLVGISRVLLQAHFATDVLAGYLIGFIYVIICLLLYETIFIKVQKNRHKKNSELSL